MSHDTFPNSVADMLLNCVGLTLLKMGLRAFQLLDDCLSTSVDHSSSLLGTSFPNASFLVGGDQLVKMAFHTSSSIDLRNAHIQAFKYP